MSRFLLTVFVLLFCVAFTHGTTSFYGKPLFSTSTPYFWERDANETIAADSAMTINHNGKTCTAIYVDALLRHGARYPMPRYIAAMHTFLTKLKNSPASVQQNPFINTWINHFPLDSNAQLTTLGQWEQYELGTRFLTRFRSLLNGAPDHIRYYATYKKRTQDSAKFFQQGVTGHPMSYDLTNATNPVIDNIMLRFFSNCNKYTTSVLNNKTAMEEYYKFVQGPEYSGVRQAVSHRVSGGAFNLTDSEVMVIHQYCAMELGLYKSSHWCSFFTQEELEVIQYKYDLYHYWRKAYGHAINSEITCPMFIDVIKGMEEAILAHKEGRSYTVGTFRFGHAETLFPIYSALSLFKDTPRLMANNYNAERNRKFRSSNISPFSGNIYPVLYKCGNSPADLFLKMFVNEVEVPLPACHNQLCPYYLFKTVYRDAIYNCRFDELCHNPLSTVSPVIVG